MAKENLEEFAYNSIVNLIQENHFKPGDFLLETELAHRFGLKSRTPIRHALCQLVAKGFLEKKKKKGCLIPQASPEDAKHVFFAREYIESAAAYSAALNATDDEIAELRSIAAREEETGKSGLKYEYSRLNEHFHSTIMRISKNQYLQRCAEHIFWRSTLYVFLFGRYYTQLDYVKHMSSPPQHAKIVEVLAQRNPEKSRKLMAEHIRFTFDQIFNLI